MLRDNQRTAAKLLAAGATQEAAAIKVGVKPPTIRHWLQLQEMQQEIKERQQSALGGLVGIAIGTLRELLESPDTPAATRLQAVNSILDRAGFQVESTERPSFNIELNLTGTVAPSPNPVQGRTLEPEQPDQLELHPPGDSEQPPSPDSSAEADVSP